MEENQIYVYFIAKHLIFGYIDSFIFLLQNYWEQISNDYNVKNFETQYATHTCFLFKFECVI